MRPRVALVGVTGAKYILGLELGAKTETNYLFARPIFFLIGCLFIGLTQAQGLRDRTRPDFEREEMVSAAQADAITLTLVTTTFQSLQTWVRTVGTIGGRDGKGSRDGKQILLALSCGPNANLVNVGQRVRAFPPDSKSSIYQAKVSQVAVREGVGAGVCYQIQARILSEIVDTSARYVMEIVVPRGQFLAIPKEAIIEDGGERIVYVSHQPGHYMRHKIVTGLAGEIYTEVVAGVDEGVDVVTIGSFFVDAEHKLKVDAQKNKQQNNQDMNGNAHRHH